MKDWIPPKSTPTPPTPPTPPATPPAPPRPTVPSADEVRARLAEVEAEVERATLALVRLWARIVDLKKEV